ncbi:MAG: tetratricopeptide repeat protein [Gammaproteobacteria bacterium]|nr:tetratricopeptide repeat protein [Gammaproteobacteria bacterium]
MSFYSELKRRNVFRVVAAYLIFGWLLAQVLALAAEAFEAPDWVMKMIITVLVLGFFPTAVFTWAFELTPDGLRRDVDVKHGQPVVAETGQKLNAITIAAAVCVGALILWQQLSGPPGQPAMLPSSPPVTQATDGTNSVVQASATLTETATQEFGDTTEKSIAVLPFANMTNMPENLPFTIGIHDDLLTSLSKIRALKVISRTSVLQYRDTMKPIGQIAQELGVNTILEGGVQRYGNQIRINVQLIDAATDDHLWAEKYDRELTAANIFEIQSEITTKIASILEARLTPAEAAGLMHAPTINLDANQAYTAGRQRMLKRTDASLQAALELFRRAAQLDPKYALAYVGQADAIMLLNEYGDMPAGRSATEGEAMVRRALELDPMLAEAHTTLAYYQTKRRNFTAAEEGFKRSLELNPNYATTYHWYGLLLRNYLGRPDAAVKMHRLAARLDPYSPIIQVNLAHSLSANAQFVEALAQYHFTADLDPEFPGVAPGIVQASRDLGRLDEVIIWLNKAIELNPGNVSERLFLSLSYLDLGDPMRARKELDRAIAMAPDHDILGLGRNMLDIYEGNFDDVLARHESGEASYGRNAWVKDSYGWVCMVTGDYQTAIDIEYELNPGDEPKTITVAPHTLKGAVNLAWSLKQTGNNEKAQELIDQALAMSKDMGMLGYRGLTFHLAYLHAVNGDVDASAEAFKKAVDAGVRSDWWTIQYLPYMQPVLEHPVFQSAYQLVIDDINAQRARLEKPEKQAPVG